MVSGQNVLISPPHPLCIGMGRVYLFPKRRSESILRLEKRKRDIGIYIVTEERMRDLRQTW